MLKSWFTTLCLGLSAASALAKEGVSLKVACGAVGIEYQLCQEAVDAWSKKTGNKAELVSTPNDTNQKLALYQQLLSAGSADIDVFLVDVIWPGILHNHLVDLKTLVPKAEIDAHFPNMIANDTVQGRLVALPQYVDIGLLFYRKDLLEKYNLKVPQTWEELAKAAETIQAGETKRDSKFTGYVFQGKAYEGLSCNALEWISSFGGGTLVDGNGRVTVNNPQAQEALKTVSTWIGGISPKGVLNYAEEEARGVFQSGSAAFMRNWPYAWNLVNATGSPVAGKVGIAPIPSGGAKGIHSPVLGGWHLSVSKYSKHVPEAVDLARYMASAAEQKRRVAKGFNPTIIALYKDPVVKGNVLLEQIGKSLATAVARPSRSTGNDYNRVSNEFWNAVYSVISSKSDPAKTLQTLEAKLNVIKKRGNWN